MDNNEKLFTQVQAPVETAKVDLDKVQLQREWVFWENYDAKPGEKMDWNKSLKDVFNFDDIITFWQFWNNYPGSDPSYIFYNGDRMRLYNNILIPGFTKRSLES